ncbi:uncharacterized protein BYT42DRAFT_596144 [Radiomyces spectabilis]|uniref:uncharacterized protein n=1 Tax=Radiomyces spectabilis TaxID=64574 RepID=UPI002220BBE6|nr:uncharacterized protein BYT42DRAFT_596144 [Radiomyces spectabilis]KAI8364676.1 hypothetical protein BYT42DRAFT_596144 [Radiomyces spectabilis]
MRFFRPCCCSSFEAFRSSCLRIVNASPVILLSLILGWAYWAYNFRLCWSLLSDGCIYIVLFQPIFSICIWCYWKVTNTSPGYTKDISKEDWDRDEEAQLLDDSENVLRSITVKRCGAQRFCQKCRLEKYDRTHHCRTCKRRQLLINRTTIEFYEKSNYRLGQNERGRVDVMRTKYFNPWDVGYKSNFTQVMGSNSTTWFLPVGRP